MVRNVSARGTVLPNAPLASGFVIAGSRSRRVLVRAIGPSLARFGVAQAIARLKLEIWAENRLCAGELMAWGGDPEMAALFSEAGAFALSPDSQDAAVVLSLPPGSYSVLAKGATPTDAGEALLELYFLE